MKKIIFFCLLMWLTSFCFAQIEVTKSEFPLYQGIVNISETSKDESYPKIKAWIATNFASANDVIQLDDKENGKIIVKGNTAIAIKSAGIPVEMRVYFALTLDIKDDRFRYTYVVSDITSGSPPNSSMSQMDRTNKIVSNMKENIGVKFKGFMIDLRNDILNTSDDNW